MPTYKLKGGLSPAFEPPRIARKLWREVSRPFRPKKKPQRGYCTGTGASFDGFHPEQATVEEEGIDLVERLVRDSRQHSGPIIEIGTLIGVTTTTMALAKAANQKIITVDLYSWTPWGIAPEAHEALTSLVLRYLVKTGHVDRVRMDKDEFFGAYAGPAPAMVFLDALHDYDNTKKDIEWAQRAGAKIIAGHDYSELFPGVKRIVDEMGGPRELAGTVWAL